MVNHQHPRLAWTLKTVLCLLSIYLASGSATEVLIVEAGERPSHTEVIEINGEKVPRIWSYDGVDFTDLTRLEVWKLEKTRNQLYAWAGYLAVWQAIAVVSVCCGSIGGFFRELYDATLTTSPNRPFIYLGYFIGAGVISTLWTIKSTVVGSDGTLQLMPVVTLAFLAGCFPVEAYSFLRRIFSQTTNTDD